MQPEVTMPVELADSFKASLNDLEHGRYVEFGSLEEMALLVQYSFCTCDPLAWLSELYGERHNIKISILALEYLVGIQE